LPGSKGISRRRLDALLISGALPHPMHHAVMLAVSAAASGQIRVGIGGQQRRNQRATEEDHQRDCDSAAHRLLTV